MSESDPTPQKSQSGGRPPKSALRENIESLLWAGVIALAIRTFIVAPYKIPSGSMRMTLVEGDRIFVNKFLYRFHDPERGDIVVFKFPLDPKRPFIKRLVGKPGDEVTIRDGKLFVDGEKLKSPEIFSENTYYNQGPYGQAGTEIHVPEDSYYMLGDNSGSSKDSREWGFVPKELVVGKAMCIFWPPKRIRLLK